MKLAILSDLHIECAHYKLEFAPADKLILAGDIISSHSTAQHMYKEFIARADDYYGKGNVLEIEGNHTGYGGDITDFKSKNIINIEDGVAIICTTLWSGDNSQYAYQCLNDSTIPGFTWEWMRNQHEENLAFIIEWLEKTKDLKQVVVTHHMPSRQCVAEKWLKSENNPLGDLNLGFYTDLDWVLDKYMPEYWVNGHTHDSFHKFHSNDRTQLVCNPRGYRRYDGSFENEDFDPYKIIEVS